MTHYIYALVDPTTHQVRYVGHTHKHPEARLHEHLSASQPIGYVHEWIRSLAPEQPTIIILQELEGTESDAIRTETKWIKRFRRTILNRNTRNNSSGKSLTSRS